MGNNDGETQRQNKACINHPSGRLSLSHAKPRTKPTRQPANPPTLAQKFKDQTSESSSREEGKGLLEWQGGWAGLAQPASFNSQQRFALRFHALAVLCTTKKRRECPFRLEAADRAQPQFLPVPYLQPT